MNRARLLRSLCLSCPLVLLALAVAVSCSNQKDTQPFVPSQRGAVQPDAGGAALDESVACLKLKGAESSARAALGCEAVTLECPDYIRPAGSGVCFQYSEGSVEACAALYQSFTTCDEFTLHPCLISTVSMCDAPVEGEGGAGGAPSVPVVGEGGSGGGEVPSGDAGTGGVAATP